MDENFAECERIVRRDDPDRAVATAFAPPDRRPFLHALYAFDAETARVRQIVSQPMPGEIRLQWWRDRIDAHAADPADASGQGSPVATALLATIDRFSLPADTFRALLDARVFDLYDDPMPTRTDLETYAGETVSAVSMLAAMILDRDAAPAASGAAGHAGVASVAASAMRMLSRRPQHAQIFFPSDILAAVGCEREDLVKRELEASRRAVAAMAAFGREHLASARTAAATLPRALRPAFLPLELVADDLAAFEAGHEAGEGKAATLKRLFRYWRAMRQ